MSYIDGAPLKRVRNVLIGGASYRSRLLMNLDDPSNGYEPVTGQTFVIEDPGSPSAGFYDPAGKFDQCYNANGTAGYLGTRGLISASPSSVWDVSSTQTDYTISMWLKLGALPPAGATTTIIRINESPIDNNNFVDMSVISSGANVQLRCSVDTSNNFVGTFLRNLPFDTNWHFYTMARIGNMHYATIDGLAPAAGSTLSAVYRRSPGLRAVVIGRNSVTRQLNGLIDAIWFVDGTPYDVVNGFAVPTTAPVLV